ncbi:hypothetical protein BpHYR1_034301 [Brachionus plicatilis]|uniref:Uncharacterized protein n=1 Tax=Brachionus plicatilis TaxID=10195 RepID=A0A3M7RUZ6_BRAPC|nr:hypothetical protein BpHYR1_034301 [Brachionus plicatilis]
MTKKLTQKEADLFSYVAFSSFDRNRKNIFDAENLNGETAQIKKKVFFSQKNVSCLKENSPVICHGHIFLRKENSGKNCAFSTI